MSSSLPVIDKNSIRGERIALAVLKLDAWLQTMRVADGFAGPISHWWESSLLYCGPMIDWRYEGIISAYVTLYQSTNNPLWLSRAKQAASDVVQAQLPSGSYRNSSFQYGPIEGGTPHEAGVDVGLLELARLLRRIGDNSWKDYFDTAERNVTAYLLGPLWSGRGFREQAWDSTLVPNKNATAIEALLLYEELSGQNMLSYVEPAAEVILSSQEHFGPRAGGTIHRGTHEQRLAIGIYTARSMCGLLRLYEHHQRAELLSPIAKAMEFLHRSVTPQGTLFGFYRDGQLIANPRWLAPTGDLLRAAVFADRYGLTPVGMIDRLVDVVVGHQLPSGAIPTAYGFTKRGGHRPYRGTPEFRDVLSVVGWCDKVLRGLSLLVPTDTPIRQVSSEATEVACTWKGRQCTYIENDQEICLQEQKTGRALYRWRKGRSWPETYAL